VGNNAEAALARALERDDDFEYDPESLSLVDGSVDVDIDREIAARSLRQYVEIAWPHVEPAVPFAPNFHVDAICDHLEAVKRAEIDRLVMNVPPGVGKSLLACVFFPSWCWTDWPGAKFITASYGEDIAKRDSLRSRNLVESQWWRERWGHQMTPNRSQWAAANYRNRQGGFRLAVGVAGGVTGEHGNVQLVDDPLKPLEVTGKLAVSKAALEKCDTWWDQTMPTRLVDAAVARVAARLIIMQRLHEADLAGRMLKDRGYVHLCLPMEYEPKYAPGSFGRFPELVGTEDAPRPCVIDGCKAEHRIHLNEPDEDGEPLLVDPRTEPGELLVPDLKPRDAVERTKRELGSRGAAAQLEQRPTPAEGSIFKRSGIRHYRRAELPKLQRLIQSWDMNFKKTESGSFVVGQVWGQAGADCYLIYQFRDRVGFSATKAAVKATTVMYPKAHKKFVEAKANGDAVVDDLRNDISGFEMVEPEGGKEARANAVEDLWAGGNVWLPHTDEAPWVLEFIEEVTAFPGAATDDQVDCMTQALVKLRRNNLDRLRRAMGNADRMGR
jgi:predicted phage terminase large subunit-like protein